MANLNQNKINFNNGLFELLKKHNLSDDEFFECLKVLYSARFRLKQRRTPKAIELNTIKEVNEFIKDKILRGTGIYKIIYPDGTYNYLVNYYDNEKTKI